MYTIYYYKVGRRPFDRAGRAQQPLTNRTPNEPASKVYMCPRIFQCVCCSWRFKCNQSCLLLSLSILPLPNFRIVHKGWIIVGPIGYRNSLGIFLAIFLLLNWVSPTRPNLHSYFLLSPFWHYFMLQNGGYILVSHGWLKLLRRNDG